MSSVLPLITNPSSKARPSVLTAITPPTPVTSEARLPEARLPEARLPEARLPEARLPEARLPEARPTSGRPVAVPASKEASTTDSRPGSQASSASLAIIRDGSAVSLTGDALTVHNALHTGKRTGSLIIHVKTSPRRGSVMTIPRVVSLVEGEGGETVYSVVQDGLEPVSIYLNGERAGTDLLYRQQFPERRPGSSDSDSSYSSVDRDTSLDVSLLSPQTVASRRTSISSLDTNLDKYLSQFEDPPQSAKTEIPEMLVSHGEIHDILGEEATMLSEQFFHKWDRLLEVFCRLDPLVIQDYRTLKRLLRSFNTISIERVLSLIDNVLSFLIREVKQTFKDNLILQVLGSRHLPQELELIFDLNRVKLYYLHEYPIAIRDEDIVGAVIKKIKGKIPVHINVLEENFLRKNEEKLHLENIRFYICEIEGVKYILKPFKNYAADTLTYRRVPKLMMFMDINLSDNKMLERNITAYELSRRLFMDGSLPRVANVVYDGKRFMAVELKLATPLIEFDVSERKELYKSPFVIRDLFNKQLFDCLLGNCDVNPTNILIDLNQTPNVIGIDYDLSLSATFKDIKNIFSMLGHRQGEFMKQQLSQASFYRGVPDIVDIDMKAAVLNFENWDYFQMLLLLNDKDTIMTNLRRLIDLKTALNTSQSIRVISNWVEGYRLIRKMSKKTRKSKTYLI